MRTTYVTWAEAVELFERRGLPKSTYENLYEEDYILHPGSASVAGGFPLNDHDDRHPWREGTPEGATGYIVDGDLTVDGNILDWDDGASALVVLGNLRAANIYLSCDPKLLVLGDVEVEAFVGDMTDKLVMIHGDLRATVTVMWREFCPDLIEGCLHGRTIAPPYIELPNESIREVQDPAPHVALADLLASGILNGANPIGSGDLEVYRDHLYERLTLGLPIIAGGRTVAALPAGE